MSTVDEYCPLPCVSCYYSRQALLSLKLLFRSLLRRLPLCPGPPLWPAAGAGLRTRPVAPHQNHLGVDRTALPSPQNPQLCLNTGDDPEEKQKKNKIKINVFLYIMQDGTSHVAVCGSSWCHVGFYFLFVHINLLTISTINNYGSLKTFRYFENHFCCYFIFYFIYFLTL